MSKSIYKISAILASALVPIMFVLYPAKLLCTHKAMAWEYKRQSFPIDVYGFSLSDRLFYGPKFLDYLKNKDLDISYLSKFKFKDGDLLFTERELSHMVDVKDIYGYIALMRQICTIMIVLILLLLSRNIGFLFLFLRYLIRSCTLFVITCISIAVFGFFAFNKLFQFFHKFLGFAPGTWMFNKSDSLIRLFPMEFWFDMFAILISSSLFLCIFTPIICKLILKYTKYNHK